MPRKSSLATWSRSRGRPISSGSTSTPAISSAPAPTSGPRSCRSRQDTPREGFTWLKITPQSMYWAVRLAAEVFGVKSFYMTESGATFDDELTPAGEVIDLHRREYLRSHLVEVHRALAEGYDVQWLFPLVAPRQLRVGRGIREAVRHRPRRVRHAAPHAEAQQPMVR